MTASRDFLTRLQSQGRFHFTAPEAMAALGRSAIATQATLRRLAARGSIATPHRGFHVIVPPEYRQLGCLPPEQFVPQLMEHLGLTYHVALLSAAEMHGAAHQRPQIFQVMVKKSRAAIHCGAVHVEFLARTDIEATPTMTRNTARGTLRLSTIEATALELVGYADACGGLDHVLTVLGELGGGFAAAPLVAAARTCPIAWSQRLGFLLEQAGHEGAATALAPYVEQRRPLFAPLVRRLPTTGCARLARWRLILNAEVAIEP